MKRFVLLAFALGGAAACGDNLGAGDDDDTVIDAAAIDAAATDASAIDASPDAAPARFSGSLTLLEAQVLAPAPAGPNTIAAQGIQLGVTFTDATLAVPPVLDTMPGDVQGCKVTELTPAQLVGALGVNEGTVQFAVSNPGTPPAPPNPVFPLCVFAPGSGYICPDATSSQAITPTTGVTLTQIDASTSRLTVIAGTATFDAADIGRYVKFSGTGQASLDASHVAIPIVAPGTSATNVIIGTGIPIAAIPLTAGSLTTLGGVGPMPLLQDPGQLADNATVTATLTEGTAGAGNNFPNTTFTTNTGDDFTMTNAMADLLRNIPRDGSAFTISCDSCGTSVGTVLNIVTTDAPVSPQSPFSMPAPITKRVGVRCAMVGATSITVPANVSAYIMNSGATRIQATFVRALFLTPTPASPPLQASIAGHAMVGFTTPPVN